MGSREYVEGAMAGKPCAPAHILELAEDLVPLAMRVSVRGMRAEVVMHRAVREDGHVRRPAHPLQLHLRNMHALLVIPLPLHASAKASTHA